MDSGTIIQSDRTQGDAVYGDGTYFASIPPDEDPEVIAENNYDDGMY